uniref:Carboxypeptidase n=1 Tax=Timema monikensis TaxID=170555 RepID=A0A7R9EEQ6_9NEOP|nr:unnamed protein product [Timema monikensis]
MWPEYILVLLWSFLSLSLCEERFLFRDSIRERLSKKERPNREAYAPTRRDVGDVLLLTPYLEEGRIEEAQDLSRVNLEPYSEITSYSGFFTVNKQFNSNLFFWYFPAEVNYEAAPVVLYLEGGPGESSLAGCFEMLGPFWVSSDENNLVPRNYSWHKNHSLIFIDNPVGAGFSYTENDAGYASNQTQVGNELYSAMSQFFTLFPELQKRDFFISGESYAGLIIGDGFTDPLTALHYSKLGYNLGLIDHDTKDIMKAYEDAARKAIKKENFTKASENWFNSLNTLKSVSGVSVYGYVDVEMPRDGTMEQGNITQFLERADVRTALHVGDASFDEANYVAMDTMLEELMVSARPKVEELLNNGYRVVFFNGELDIIVGYPLIVNLCRSLEFTSREEYLSAERHKWFVDGELAGFVKKGGNLTEIMVRGAGHNVPLYVPKQAFDLIYRITRNELP